MKGIRLVYNDGAGYIRKNACWGICLGQWRWPWVMRRLGFWGKINIFHANYTSRTTYNFILWILFSRPKSINVRELCLYSIGSEIDCMTILERFVSMYSEMLFPVHPCIRLNLGEFCRNGRDCTWRTLWRWRRVLWRYLGNPTWQRPE